MKKIIFLGLGVVLLASFGRFSQRDFNTKEFSLKGLQASVLSNPNDHTIGNSLFNYIPLVTQKLVYGLRESALKSMTAGFANAPVLIQYEGICDHRFQGTLTQPIDQFLSHERYKEASLRAAIDFGSGSIKIQTALIDPASQKMVGEPLMLKYVPLTLSEDIASHEGYISIEMQRKAHEILAKFKEEAQAIAASKGYSHVEFSGIATAVFRKAENGKDLLQKIEKDLGIHFQILSQEEEGRLGFLSAKILYLEIDEENLLVWDSGNGSFQITAKIGDTYKIYQGPLGHGTVRVLLSKEIREGKVLEGHVSGNPVQRDEASQVVQGIENLLPEIPSWLQDKLSSQKTIIVTFGDGESIFALVSRALEKSSGDAITRLEVKKVLGMSLDRDDDFFDSNNLHRKTGTSALLVSSIMDHFDMQTIHYKTAVGNTSGILSLPDLWKGSCKESSQQEKIGLTKVEVTMEERPNFL